MAGESFKVIWKVGNRDVGIDGFGSKEAAGRFIKHICLLIDFSSRIGERW